MSGVSFGFGGSTSWWVLAMATTFCLASMMNFVLLAENRLSLPTENRVTPLRVGFAVQFLLLVAWMLSFIGEPGNTRFSAAEALGVLGGVHLAVVAMFTVTEDLILPRRVLVRMQARSPMAPPDGDFSPGGGRGALYVLAQMAILLLAVWLLRPASDGMRWFLAICGYICFFTGVPVAAFRLARPAQAASFHLRVVVLVLLPVAMLLPDILYYMLWRPEVFDLSFGTRHLISPFRDPGELASGPGGARVRDADCIGPDRTARLPGSDRHRHAHNGRARGGQSARVRGGGEGTGQCRRPLLIGRRCAPPPRFRLAMPRTPIGGRVGERLGAGTGSSLEFQDYRPYAPGDDLRHVDWAAYARSEVLAVRLYREEVAPRIDLVLDVSRSMVVTDEKRRAYGELLGVLACACASTAADSRIITTAADQPQPLHVPEDIERYLACDASPLGARGTAPAVPPPLAARRRQRFPVSARRRCARRAARPRQRAAGDRPAHVARGGRARGRGRPPAGRRRRAAASSTGDRRRGDSRLSRAVQPSAAWAVHRLRAASARASRTSSPERRFVKWREPWPRPGCWRPHDVRDAARPAGPAGHSRDRRHPSVPAAFPVASGRRAVPLADRAADAGRRRQDRAGCRSRPA